MKLINCKFCETKLNKETKAIWGVDYCCIWCQKKKILEDIENRKKNKESHSPLNVQESGDRAHTLPFHSSPGKNDKEVKHE